MKKGRESFLLMAKSSSSSRQDTHTQQTQQKTADINNSREAKHVGIF
jgi:hypothetical protein